MNTIIDLFKALSDETRLRIINLIYKQDLCVCELVEILDLSQPKISKHIAKLRQIGLVNTERKEQYIYYSFNHSNKIFVRIIQETLKSINVIEILNEDVSKLDKIESFVCNR